MHKNIITSFVGAKIFSDFRKASLLKKIQELYPEINDINSAYLHLVETNEELTPTECDRIKQIFDYRASPIAEIKISANAIYIGPRVGTISPWSSRATDIALHCDINF